MIFSSLSENFVGKVVLLQAVVLSVGTALTLIYLYLRNLWNDYENQKKNIYTEEIINMLFVESKSQVLPFLLWWDRAIYRDVLLSQIKVLIGQERDIMLKHYIDMKFLAADYIEVESRSWWKRLRALIRIDVLALTESRIVYLKAIKDSNNLVVLEATRALSRLPQNVSPNMLFMSLERVGLRRQTALLEIITNIGSNYSVEAICDYLQICDNEEMAVACVKVLGDLRAYQALTLLEEVIINHEDYSEKYLVKVLDALSLISDPEAIEMIRPLLNHSSPLVRARSLNTLSILGDNKLNLENLKNTDTDVEVQRVIQKIQKSAA